MPHVDLSFRLMGNDPIPADHGYALYGAISRVLPVVHQSDGIGIHPIRGRIVGERQMALTTTSRLVIRAASDRIGDLLPLAGKQLVVAGRALDVGVPQVFALTPSTMVRSRLVVIKVSSDTPAPPTGDAFLASLRRKLAAFNVTAESPVTLVKRRTIRLHQKEVVGYEVVIEHLTADESLALQANSPTDSSQRFGRNHMGCGIFTALLPRGSAL